MRFSFLDCFIAQVISIKILFFNVYLNYETGIENLEYCIKRQIVLLENCFSRKLSCDVVSTSRPLESSFPSVKIALLSYRNL